MLGNNIPASPARIVVSTPTHPLIIYHLNMESRSIAFTCFDINLDELKKKLHILNSSYFIVGLETCPSTGRQHYQGFAQFGKKFTMKKIAKTMACHCEIPKGSVEDNINYCKKENNYIEEGTVRGISKNNEKQARWRELIQLAKAGDTEAIETKYPSAAIIHRKSLTSIRDEAIKADHHPERKCIWIWGKAGVGKSRWAHENFNSTEIFTLSDTDGWDLYTQERVALLDEVDDTIQVNWKRLLRWADRYPIRARRLYGTVALNYELLILTSMKDPSTIFSGNQWDAISRRFIIVEAIGYDANRQDLIIKDNRPFNLYLRNYLFKYNIIF